MPPPPPIPPNNEPYNAPSPQIVLLLPRNPPKPIEMELLKESERGAYNDFKCRLPHIQNLKVLSNNNNSTEILDICFYQTNMPRMANSE